MKSPVLNVSVSAIRWTGRIASMLFAILVLAFLIGEGVNFKQLTSKEILLFVAFAILWFGYAAGWKNEKYGGLLIVSGWLAFYIINFIPSGNIPSGWLFPIMIIPGLLFLWCWRKS